MSRKAKLRARRKLRHWADEVTDQNEVVLQVIARLQGRVLRYYVLARSYTQYCKWWEDNQVDVSAIYVIDASDLHGVRLNSVIQLVELDGWEAVADDELKFLVRLLKRTAK